VGPDTVQFLGVFAHVAGQRGTEAAGLVADYSGKAFIARTGPQGCLAQSRMAVRDRATWVDLRHHAAHQSIEYPRHRPRPDTNGSPLCGGPLAARPWRENAVRCAVVHSWTFRSELQVAPCHRCESTLGDHLERPSALSITSARWGLTHIQRA